MLRCRYLHFSRFRRSKSVYEIFNVQSSIKPTELTKLMNEENLPLSREDELEIKSYLRDPIRYQLATELKEKRLSSAENEISFFGPKTESAISKLPEASQEQIKNSTAHLSFRSGTYIVIILFYFIMRSTMITKEERNRLSEKDYGIKDKSFSDFYEAFSFNNIFENLPKLISWKNDDSSEK